jgi:hypothetical protein
VTEPIRIGELPHPEGSLWLDLEVKRIEYRDYRDYLETVWRSTSISGEFPNERACRSAVAAHIRKVRREHGRRLRLRLKHHTTYRKVNLNPHGLI